MSLQLALPPSPALKWQRLRCRRSRLLRLRWPPWHPTPPRPPLKALRPAPLLLKHLPPAMPGQLRMQRPQFLWRRRKRRRHPWLHSLSWLTAACWPAATAAPPWTCWTPTPPSPSSAPSSPQQASQHPPYLLPAARGPRLCLRHCTGRMCRPPQCLPTSPPIVAGLEGALTSTDPLIIFAPRNRWAVLCHTSTSQWCSNAWVPGSRVCRQFET